MTDPVHRVAAVCGVHYGAQKPCNDFTREVAHSLGVRLPVPEPRPTADSIVRAMSQHWRELSPHGAILAAGRGEFVVAGLESKNMKPKLNPKTRNLEPRTEGHVCVVIPGKIGAYPRVISTNADTAKENPHGYGKSRGDHPLSGHVFNADDAKKVRYFAP